MECPDCGASVCGVATRGPSKHFLAPCGCRVSNLIAREFAADVDRGRGLATDGGDPWTSGTERVEHEDIAITDDGDLVEITRVHYHRYTDRIGICPFCRSEDDVEYVDEVGPGGTYRKQRFECECGAFGERRWTWKAGLKDDADDIDRGRGVATDGGREMTEWECGGCGDTFESPGEPELACLLCGADDWQEVDAE